MATKPKKKSKEKRKDERGEYRGMYVVLIDSPEFAQLSADATACFYPLKFKLGRAGIAVFDVEALPRYAKIPSTRVREALTELIDSDFLRVEGTIFWLRNGLRFEPSRPLDQPNMRASIEAYLETLPKLQIVNDFANYYSLAVPFEIPSSTLPNPETLAEGLRNPSRQGKREEGRGKTYNGNVLHPPPPTPSKNGEEVAAEAVDNTVCKPHGDNYVPKSDTPETVPDTTTAIAAIDSLLAETLDRLKAEGMPNVALRSLRAQVGPIVNGLDANVWRDEGGGVVPWDQRPGLLALALARYEVEPGPNRLRSHVRYVIGQQLHPFEPKASGSGPSPPGLPAGVVHRIAGNYDRAAPPVYEYENSDTGERHGPPGRA